MRLPGIHEVLVTGDSATRELKATVYATVSEETVKRQIAALNRQLPVYKRIRVVEARPEPFPRTGSGKICLAKLRLEGPSGTSAKPHDAAAFFKAYALPLLVFAVTVMLANVAEFVLARLGLRLPESLSMAAEFGEIVLAVLVLLVVLGVRHRNRTKALERARSSAHGITETKKEGT